MKSKSLRLLLLVVVILSFMFSYYYVTSLSHITTHYTLSTSLTAPLRIVHLTDLHNEEQTEDLTSIITTASPDLILMTGDMINEDEEDLTTITTLITSLASIAPVYYGYGNHEYVWEKNFGDELRQALTDAGAIVLDNEYIDIEVKGQQLRIGGYMGYYRQPHMFKKSQEQTQLERAFFNAFEDTNRFKILLNHIPTGWLDWEYIDKFPVDLVFSGHYHGGLIRIPLLDQALYAPYVGAFPPYTKGMYTGTKATCILSTGLGAEHGIPRINNPREVVVVDLVE